MLAQPEGNYVPLACYSPEVQMPVPIQSVEHSTEHTKDSSHINFTGRRARERRQRMLKFQPEFIKNAKGLHEKLMNVYNKEQVYIKGSRKPKPSKNTKHPEKRSKFIGVAKNGVKWQTLVCYKGEKIFLGNYDTEEEAAYVVDLYSILAKGKTAKVNRDYTISSVLRSLSELLQKS